MNILTATLTVQTTDAPPVTKDTGTCVIRVLNLLTVTISCHPNSWTVHIHLHINTNVLHPISYLYVVDMVLDLADNFFYCSYHIPSSSQAYLMTSILLND